jgi:hypothetical protein
MERKSELACLVSMRALLSFFVSRNIDRSCTCLLGWFRENMRLVVPFYLARNRVRSRSPCGIGTTWVLMWCFDVNIFCLAIHTWCIGITTVVIITTPEIKGIALFVWWLPRFIRIPVHHTKQL